MEGKWAQLKSTRLIKSLASTYEQEITGLASVARTNTNHLQAHYTVRTLWGVAKKLHVSMRTTVTVCATDATDTLQRTQPSITYGK